MKFKYIVAIISIIIISFSYYIGSVISKENIKPNKVSSVATENNNNDTNANKNVNINTNVNTNTNTNIIYTQAQQKELNDAKKIVSLGNYPIQKDVQVVTSLKYDKEIMIPQGTYVYEVDGSKIGLANMKFQIYAISNSGVIKNISDNPLQTKPSPYNVNNISTNAGTLNIIGAINGYYYVNYSEVGSNNINYAFIKKDDVSLNGNTKPREPYYISADNLKLYKIANISDYKVSGFKIYKTPYMFSNIETILSYEELKDFTPVVLAKVGDAVEIYYNGQIGWIHTNKLISF